MECPRCSAGLISKTYENINMETCLQCGGIWLGNANLRPILSMHDIQFSPAIIEQTLKQAHAGIPKAEVDTLLPCPDCSQNMYALNYSYSSGIIVNVCSNGHGMWFDKDELEEVQIFMEHWNDEEQKNQDKLLNLEMQMKAEVESKIHSGDEETLGKMGPINQILIAVFGVFEMLMRIR